jgi:hypothetical protein
MGYKDTNDANKYANDANYANYMGDFWYYFL